MKSIIFWVLLAITPPKQPIIPTCGEVFGSMDAAHKAAGHELLNSTPIQYGVLITWGSAKEAKVWSTAFLTLGPKVKLVSDVFKRKGSCTTQLDTLAEYFTAEYSAN